MNILDKIRVGMTRDEVTAAIGPPDDVSIGSRRYRTPRVYKYGAIELHFEPEKGGK